ncbi:ATP-binding protein [Streptomyces sp. NPDC058464]|uniref:ATP-binding protein n=1 Tax=Streptomyces sp. NPDC058464 TaxID=3346511 RepID=UPI00365A5826
MPPASSGTPAFEEPPDPCEARHLDELIVQLRQLKVWAGNPSYETITKRVNESWRNDGLAAREWTTYKNTVAACFMVGRRRPNDDLLLGIVRVLNPDIGYVTRWRQALRIVRGEAEAASFVQAQASLPDDIAQFTGRAAEIALLTGVVGVESRALPVVISAIEGMAGIGKTGLAVRAGRLLLRQHDVDRVLFVNLRGFHDESRQPPADPAAVLDSFLRLLGVSGHDIPLDVDRRAALYRKRLRDRPTLVVLDNAADAAQVRPLLPDDALCQTLITSRRTLSDLEGVRHLELDVFTPEEALGFLRRTVGAERVDAERDAAGQVTAVLGYLPLALRLAATRLNTRPNWSLGDELRRLLARRSELRLDDPLENSIGLSYDDLAAQPRHILRLLSLHPGDDFESQTAAALVGSDPSTMEQQLTNLLRNNLIVRRKPGRFELHDLVRTYAAVRAHDEERVTDLRDSADRLVSHYMRTTTAAMDLLYPVDQQSRPHVQASDTHAVPLPDEASARSWLDSERANLLAVATDPRNQDPSAVAVAFATLLHRHLLTGAHYSDAQLVNQFAATAAEQSGDQAGQARTLTNLGAIFGLTGQYDEAVRCLEHAVILHETAADLYGQARALNNLGGIYARMGQHDQAARHLQHALDTFREIGSVDGQAHALTNLGSVYEQLGRYGQAADHHRQTLTLCRESGDAEGQAHALTNLGVAIAQVGQHEEAAAYHSQALELFRGLGDRYGQAHALTNIGFVHERLGRHEQAATSHQQGLALFREIGDPEGQTKSLNGLGKAHMAAGNHTDALAAFSEAGQQARATGDLHGQAHASFGLGDAYHKTADHDRAGECWREALALYERIGATEAEEVRTRLDADSRRDAPGA